MIREIDASSIDQIISGQVITNLSSAIKELLENSLDAGASVIDIRLVNHGKDGFSVQDNGHGINPNDFEMVACKHATSKLHKFSDLGNIDTLGFRGEALSSLCALGKVQMTTNDGSLETAHLLKFDSAGKLINCVKVAAPRGTLVEVNDLFYHLPVRRVTFERNSHREYSKVLSLLQEYSLFSNARITLEHVVKNRKNVALRSQGSQLLQRVASIYGSRRTKTLDSVNFGPENTAFKSFPNLDVTLSGLISKPTFGMGDQASTCQLIAVNNRPCQQDKIKKAIVEVYKQFNYTEVPFFILNIGLSSSKYDVNVTPDKRSLLLHDEKQLVECIRSAFTEFFGNSTYSIPASGHEMPPMKKLKQANLFLSSFAGKGSMISQNSTRNMERNLTSSKSNETCDNDDNNMPVEDSDGDTMIPSTEPEQSSNFALPDEIPRTLRGRVEAEIDDSVEEESRDQQAKSSEGVLVQQIQPLGMLDRSDTGKETSNLSCCTHHCSDHDNRTPTEESNNLINQPNINSELHLQNVVVTHTGSEPLQVSPQKNDQNDRSASRVQQARQKTLNTHILVPLTIEDVAVALKKTSKSAEKAFEKLHSFPVDDEDVEKRLQLKISKSDFNQMEVVGQFNLGFILVVNRKSRYDDLFVIDQHASDEIYNFERLQQSTVLSRQPLVIPYQLELSAVEELLIQEHLSIFENNGFSISVRPEMPPGHQCFLESVPFSKSTVFDEKDVLELLSKLKDDPNQPHLRCSKLRAMFAMRACRSSIMIGHPLDRRVMETVVKNMGTLDKPWNCPHGRPTLRHITTLS